jgi:regulator of Ty1 transposition protein 103
MHETSNMKLNEHSLELDRSRASSSKRGLGGSLFAESTSSIPSKLKSVFDTHNSLTQAESKSSSAISTFESESENKQAENDSSLPRKAAHLGSLLQALETAQSGVSASMKARQTLMASLEALLADNKSALSREETQLSNLVTKKAAVDSQKRHVEDMIVRGSASNGSNDIYDPPRPDAEPLTPPPVESLTPVDSPKPVAAVPSIIEPSTSVPMIGSFPGITGTLPEPITEPIPEPLATADGHLAEPAPKRRKIGGNDDEFVFNSDALGGIDPDVAAMLAR